MADSRNKHTPPFCSLEISLGKRCCLLQEKNLHHHKQVLNFHFTRYHQNTAFLSCENLFHSKLTRFLRGGPGSTCRGVNVMPLGQPFGYFHSNLRIAVCIPCRTTSFLFLASLRHSRIFVGGHQGVLGFHLGHFPWARRDLVLWLPVSAQHWHAPSRILV